MEVVTWYCEPTGKLIQALQLVDTIRTKLAFPADACYILDTHAIAFFPEIFHVFCYRGYNTSPFVAQDTEGCLADSAFSKPPFVAQKGFISGAEATIINLAQDLTRARDRNIDRLDLHPAHFAFAMLHSSLLLVRNKHGRVFEIEQSIVQ